MMPDSPMTEEMSQKFATRQGQYLVACQEKLIRQLSCPQRGERLLFVGFIPPELTLPFFHAGCLTTTFTSFEPGGSKIRREQAKPPGARIDYFAELPFSDNEFDLVVVQAALEFCARPELLIAEAARVAHRRVFIGVLNRFAPLMAFPTGDAIFPRGLALRPRSYHLGKMKALIRECMGPVEIFWGSQVFFPFSWGRKLSTWEERIPLIKNPLGALLGLSFPSTGRFQTVQQAIVSREEVLSHKRGIPARGLTRLKK